MLIGQYTGIISAKRRIVVPRKFLQIFGEKLVIAKWYEGCLVCVGKDNLQALLNRLTAKAESVTAPIRDTDRFLLGSAFELEPDKQGRVVLPEILAEYAQLRKKIVFLGLADRIEIWDQELWQKQEKYVSQKASELMEEVAKGRIKDEKDS